MTWVDQKMMHYAFEAKFKEYGIDIEDFGCGEPGHTVYIEPMSKEDAHSYAFILRKCAQHLERVGRSLPTDDERMEQEKRILGVK